jgi:CRISPR-associated endonuclease Csn1
VATELTPRIAAAGTDCDFAHIIPRACGGHNGLNNLVLAHRKCNQDMGRRTPRQFWEEVLKVSFEDGMRRVEGIYGNVSRPKPSEVKGATADALWSCYFEGRPGRFGPTFDQLKIDQFKKAVSDTKEMTPRQEAATKYAARQVMAYLADAIYEGDGLPERGGKRMIFASDGMWTSRLRREWGLFFDAHDAKKHGLSADDEHERKEKNRGDHRHHAIDAIVIALCSEEMKKAWTAREKRAENAVRNPADEEQLENYRRTNRIPIPAPYKSREELRDAVKKALFGDGEVERPVAHRPVKRKLTGALHEETLFGPVVDREGKLTENFTAKKSVLALDANHLRMPSAESKDEAIERLATSRRREIGADEKTARKWAKAIVESAGYAPLLIDPPPGKSGIVRDRALRAAIRQCLADGGLDPENFSKNDLKKLIDSGRMRQRSGVPINTVVLLRTMSDPVLIPRKRPEYASGRMATVDDLTSHRAYVGGNNHHIEIRALTGKRGEEKWKGEVVTAFVAARRNLARLRALREAKLPSSRKLAQMAESERAPIKQRIREIEKAHPLVDRTDDDAKGGKFVMSLCEGEMLLMRHKQTKEVNFFVVAKLDKPQGIVLVPHWDARAAGERKDSEGKKVPDSKRDQFTATPNDLRALAPPGHEHAVKVRVSPLGKVTILNRD